MFFLVIEDTVLTGQRPRLLISLSSLKGLGHAILGNFRTDQMVIELTKI